MSTRVVTNSDYGDESNPNIEYEKGMVFVVIGSLVIAAAIGAVAFFGGFDVVDEYRSMNWPETEVISVGQDYDADEGTQTFFYNYSVEGVAYNSTFSCDFNVHGASEQTQGGSGIVEPWKTQCLHDSAYYLNLESVAYNPDDPSEIDVYPGFTGRAVWEIYAPKLAPIPFVFVGIVFVFRGRRGPSFGPWAFFAKKFTDMKEKMLEGMKENKE